MMECWKWPPAANVTATLFPFPDFFASISSFISFILKDTNDIVEESQLPCWRCSEKKEARNCTFFPSSNLSYSTSYFSCHLSTTILCCYHPLSFTMEYSIASRNSPKCSHMSDVYFFHPSLSRQRVFYLGSFYIQYSLTCNLAFCFTNSDLLTYPMSWRTTLIYLLRGRNFCCYLHFPLSCSYKI